MLNPEICDAIRDRKLLEFSYDGGVRTVEPYCYGIMGKGKECLNAYQVDGYSASSKKYGWKLFDLRKIGPITILDKTFNKPREGYVKGGSGMKKVFCEVGEA